MQQLPWLWRAVADALEAKYKKRGWKKLIIHLPDWTNLPKPLVYAWAVDLHSEEFHFVVTQDEDGFEKLNQALSRHDKGLPWDDEPPYEEPPTEE